MSKPAAITLAALFTAAFATGCTEDVAELACDTPEACGIEFRLDPGFFPPSALEGLAVAGVPTIDHGRLQIPVTHAPTCENPEAVVTVQGIGRSQPPTALASLDLFAGRCEMDAGRDQDVNRADAFAVAPATVLSDLSVELADILPPGTCVGHVVLALPDTEGHDGEPVRITLDQPVCGAGGTPALPTRD